MAVLCSIILIYHQECFTNAADVLITLSVLFSFNLFVWPFLARRGKGVGWGVARSPLGRGEGVVEDHP